MKIFRYSWSMEIQTSWSALVHSAVKLDVRQLQTRDGCPVGLDFLVRGLVSSDLGVVKSKRTPCRRLGRGRPPWHCNYQQHVWCLWWTPRRKRGASAGGWTKAQRPWPNTRGLWWKNAVNGRASSRKGEWCSRTRLSWGAHRQKHNVFPVASGCLTPSIS